MRRALPEAGGEILAEAFDAYRTVFARVTARAPRRFARRDWHGMQADALERLDLYSRTLTPALAELGALPGRAPAREGRSGPR